MVWVLTNKNRNSFLEIHCSLPIAYGLKDYKMSAKEMRDTTEYVLEKCHENGIHVVGFYTDGQWISLMHRDSDNNPIILLQIQMSTKGLSKADLIRNLTSINCNRDKNNPLDHICWQKELTGSLCVDSKDVDSQKIITNLDKKLWCTNNTNEH